MNDILLCEHRDDPNIADEQGNTLQFLKVAHVAWDCEQAVLPCVYFAVRNTWLRLSYFC